MSFTNNTTTSSPFKDAATGVVESGAYATERAKQGVDATKPHVDNAASTEQSAFANVQESLAGASEQASAAANDFQAQAAAHTNAAASEGQQDVENAKATAGTYLDSAKGLADSALGTVQSYIVAGQEKLGQYHAQNPPDESTRLGSVTATLHSTAATTLEATKGYLASAQSALQPQAESVRPHVESAAATAQQHANTLAGYGTAASEAVQPHIDAARDTVQPHLNAAQQTIQPHLDAAQQAIQPHVDAAQEAIQPHVDAASERINSMRSSNSTQ